MSAKVPHAVQSAGKSVISSSSPLHKSIIKSGLQKEDVKEKVGVLRWLKAFQQCKGSEANPSAFTRDEKLGRFTNFSLEHIYDKYRYIQTHLLVREALIPTIHGNPDVMDPHLLGLHTIYLQPHHKHIDALPNESRVPSVFSVPK